MLWRRCLSWGGGGARADNTFTKITISAPDPNDVCIGDHVTYYLAYTGSDPVQSVKWQWTCNDCTPKSTVDWVTTNGGGPVGTTETLLGNFTITATVTFQHYPVGGTYQQTKTIDVAVNPPDHVVLSNGTAVLGVNVPLSNGSPNLFVKFTMLRGSRSNIYPLGTPVEYVHNSDPRVLDHLWTDSVPFMSISANVITDGKGVDNSAAWPFYNPGDIFDELDQNLGVKLPTGCGGTREIHFPETFHFRYMKIDNNNYQLLSP